MTLEELHAELAAGTIRPAYLIAGEEPLQRDEALAALRAHVLAGAPWISITTAWTARRLSRRPS